MSRRKRLYHTVRSEIAWRNKGSLCLSRCRMRYNAPRAQLRLLMVHLRMSQAYRSRFSSVPRGTPINHSNGSAASRRFRPGKQWNCSETKISTCEHPPRCGWHGKASAARSHASRSRLPGSCSARPLEIARSAMPPSLVALGGLAALWISQRVLRQVFRHRLRRTPRHEEKSKTSIEGGAQAVPLSGSSQELPARQRWPT